MEIILLCLLAYLCGSVAFGKIIGARMGIDIQSQGSGNIGFANAYRVLGPRPAYLVLAGDILKGFIPALAAAKLVSVEAAMWIGTLAIVGHVFPAWLKFRGGKGVATAFGVSLALFPWIAGAGLAVYLMVLAVLHKSAIASLVAAASLPVWSFVFAPSAIVWYCLLLAFAVFTHRNNLRGTL